jgi:hypothetical protein
LSFARSLRNRVSPLRSPEQLRFVDFLAASACICGDECQAHADSLSGDQADPRITSSLEGSIINRVPNAWEAT